MKKFWKNLSLKKRFFIIFLLLLMPIQTLNFTGFCYSEMRYLSDLELTYAGIVFPAGTEASIRNDQNIIKSPDKDYPFCCYTEGESKWSSPQIRFLNKLFGHYRYSVTSYVPDPNLGKPHSYYQTLSSLNSCGKSVQYETGTQMNRESYEENIKLIKSYWENRLKQ